MSGIFAKNPFDTNMKLLCHYKQLSEYFLNGDTWPVFMEINLTDVCNLNCSWCFTTNRSLYTLDFELFKKFAVEFYENGGRAITFTGGGEPTLHPQFEEIVKFSKEVGFKIALISNGLFPRATKEFYKLLKEEFEWIRISYDFATSSKFLLHKGVDGSMEVLTNIIELWNTPGKATLGVCANVTMDHTVEDVEILIGSVWNVCNYVQFRPVLPRYYMKEKLEFNDEVWSYLKSTMWHESIKLNLSLDKLDDIKNNKTHFNYDKCVGHHFCPVLNADGKVYICMYHIDNPKFELMDLNKTSFKKGWLSKQRAEAVHYTENELNYEEECQMCCKLTEINKFIYTIKNPQIKDIHFL